MKLESTLIRFKSGNKIPYIDCYNNESKKGVPHDVEWYVAKEDLSYYCLIELLSEQAAYPILIKINDLKN